MRVFLSLPMNGKDNEWIRNEKEKMIRNFDAMCGDGVKNTYVDTIDMTMPADIFLENIGEGDEIVNRIWFLSESLKIMSKCDVVLFHPEASHAKGCCVEYFTATKYGIDEVSLDITSRILETYICRFVIHSRRDKVQKFLYDAGIWSRELLMKYSDNDILKLQKTTKGLGPTYAHEIINLRNSIEKAWKEGEEN